MRLRFVPTITLCFNPRTRVGCDGQLVLSISQRLFVSIHAPAWGATPRPLTGFLRHKSFNPRTRVGCDIRGDKEFGGDNWFQSTHPRGVRPQAGVPEVEAQAWFQSTHPRGVRHTLYKLLPQHWKFQSTHPRGVRRQRAAVCHLSNCVSIHAPAWGATPPRGCAARPTRVSIHPPAGGATLLPVI